MLNWPIGKTVREPTEVNMQDNDRVTPLAVMDPGYDRPEYWERQHGRIMERVAFELARRRAAVRESVAAVLSGWSRSLIPVAVAAAVIAAVLVTAETRRQAEPAPQLVLQDILGEGEGDRPFEALLSADRAASAVTFMALVEGGRP